jgi:cellulose synthase/poly-beta-1,6-N-acetylglucosamine synthase-like glycosyltransferase
MKRRRILEILPGFVSWNLILFLIWGGYFFPVVTAYFILAFDVFWVWKGFSMTVATFISHLRIKAAERLDWMREVKGFGDWERVKHVVMIMIANEPPETYTKTVEALTRQTFPLKQIAVVMATEERYPNGIAGAEKLGRTLGKKFGEYLITVHPANITGEIKGKSSNEAWAAREAKRILVDEKGWNMDYLTITSNDADAILHPQYFSYLTFKFLDDPNRYLKFWQPAIVFYNNIWRIPAMTRVINTFSNIWQIGLLVRRDRLINFSNYSATFSMIDKIGYWDTDVIPEDYRIFFKAFFKLDGKVEVEPIFLPSSADAAESTSMWKTFINEYEQKKRWAWGVSDLPLFIEMYLKQPRVSFLNKSLRILRVVQDHLLWPVNWFIITVGVSVVTIVNPVFKRTSLGFTLPRISSGILTVTLILLAVLLIIEFRHRPPRPKDTPRWRVWLAPFEFILMPISGFFFNALPGLDAHTRLMLGKYIEYRITEKVK